jgi:hydroxymethylglutaryl-CoA synthase
VSSIAHPIGSLLATGAALPADRVPIGRARRCAARPDEDAVTLAAEAGYEALAAGGGGAPTALILAGTTLPYDEGGSVQALAELLGMDDAIFATELSATIRDGLAAVRVGLALAGANGAPVLVCAGHATHGAGDAESGDGAVALLLGPAGCDDALAELRMGPSHVEELRDRWRLRGDDAPRDGDASFIGDFGATRLGSSVGRAAAGDSGLPVAVAALNARAAGKAERALGGPGDDLVARTGILGAAHPLLRLVCGLDAPRVVLAAAGGLADSLTVIPAPAADATAASLRARAAGGVDRDTPVPAPSGEGFEPYSSGPRAWRERGQDLRLEGVRYGERLFFPPPAAPPADDPDATGEVVALARTGTVLTQTRDHVYPGGDVTGMAVLDLDDGARFYGQVIMGEQVDIGDRVRLVPRRLHEGGGVVQYFWKAAPCR